MESCFEVAIPPPQKKSQHEFPRHDESRASNHLQSKPNPYPYHTIPHSTNLPRPTPRPLLPTWLLLTTLTWKTAAVERLDGIPNRPYPVYCTNCSHEPLKLSTSPTPPLVPSDRSHQTSQKHQTSLPFPNPPSSFLLSHRRRLMDNVEEGSWRDQNSPP